MARFIKKVRNYKRIFLMILIIILTALSSVWLYDMYIKIETKGNHKFGTYTVNTVSDFKTSDNVSYNSSKVSNIENNYVSEEKTLDIIEKVTKSVVGISKIKNAGSSVFTIDGVSDLNFGSGVIVSKNGYIVSNWHVTGDKLSKCYVTLANGSNYEGNVVWADNNLDLSILKIDSLQLDYASLSDSDKIRVGQTVYAVGNPIGFEFQRTVTKGIVSAINRTIKIEEGENISYLEDLVQTDATINEGNSGGPLINNLGEIIAINTVKIISAEGIGFAVPIEIIKPIIESFVTKGSFEEVSLGVYGFDKEVIPYLNSEINFNGNIGGIYVAKVLLDGNLYKTGIKTGDIILKIDGIELNKMSELRKYIYTKSLGDIVNLTILRNNKELNISVNLK